MKRLRIYDDWMNEFINSLANDRNRELKVVSILGPACLGKTTLAKQVYDKIGSLFDCKACFSVSQRPDMTELLNKFQLKLGKGLSSVQSFRNKK